MDRIAPTRRPPGKAVGYQRWSDLLFLHWPVKESDLRPQIPDSLTIDTFDGHAYIGLVPFTMSGVRPAWWPRALAFRFLEANLRTYVHVNGRDPGVYFFSLEAASRLAVTAARMGWSLPYFYARMSTTGHEADVIDYRSERRQGNPRTRQRPSLHVSYRVGTELGASIPDTLEFFLFERYLLHVERRGRLHTGQVHHQPYPVWTADVETCEEDLIQAAGLQSPEALPALAHFSPGVDVEIFRLAPQPSADPS